MTVEQLRDLHKPRTWWKHPDAEDDDADHFPSEEAVRESVRRVFAFDEKPFSWDEQRLFATTVDYCEGRPLLAAGAMALRDDPGAE